MSFKPESMTIQQLLKHYAIILKELRHRKVVRTNNSPVGDYAEWLIAERLNLTLAPNSTSGYDAFDSSGVRYQIKSRIASMKNRSMPLSAIRNLGSHDFDYLIAVVFNDLYEIEHVIKVPHEVIEKYAQYRAHVNAHIFIFCDSVLNDPKIENITSRFLD